MSTRMPSKPAPQGWSTLIAVASAAALLVLAASPGCDCGGRQRQRTSGTGGPENCANGVDDDGDGGSGFAWTRTAPATPCARPPARCAPTAWTTTATAMWTAWIRTAPATSPAPIPRTARTGVDDNGDGDTDCADVLCAGIHPACGEICGDGIDNDGDGDVDCNDSNCAGFPACNAPPPSGDICAYGGDEPHTCECADGLDNDGDGNIDSADIHCFGPLDDNEAEFATGIPGDNNGANAATECPFDGNSGTGNDKDACCNADASMNATPNGCDSLGCCEVDINGNGTGEHVGIYGDVRLRPRPAACRRRHRRAARAANGQRRLRRGPELRHG